MRIAMHSMNMQLMNPIPIHPMMMEKYNNWIQFEALVLQKGRMLISLEKTKMPLQKK